MLKIGDVLTLELKYSDKDEKFKCKLVERGGPHLYIDYPINIDTNRTAFFIDGTQLKCSFVHDNSVYWFETEVVGRVKQNIPMIMLSYPGDDQLMKIQRRQYVRVETPIDVAVHPTNFEFSPFVTITDDISAGGAAILISNRLTANPGQLIHTWLVLPMQNGEYHYLKLMAKVVRIIPFENGRNKASLEFVDIDSHHRQLLLRFCFDRQLVMRKKGLLEQGT